PHAKTAATPEVGNGHADQVGGTSKAVHRSRRGSRDTPRKAGPGIRFPRYFTRAGVDPMTEVKWELRAAGITGADGQVYFEQKDVEFPCDWSQTATNVVVQKYFRGTLGTPQRERSVKQMISRVADTIYKWGKADGYFKTAEDALAFRDELVHLL